jgi:hypothetical protein
VQELDCLARREVGLVAVTRDVEEAAISVRECRECSPELAARLQVWKIVVWYTIDNLFYLVLFFLRKKKLKSY